MKTEFILQELKPWGHIQPRNKVVYVSSFIELFNKMLAFREFDDSVVRVIPGNDPDDDPCIHWHDNHDIEDDAEYPNVEFFDIDVLNEIGVE